MTIILGVDPGSRITGYGIIQVQPNHAHTFLAAGCIRLEKEDLGGKLRQIHHVLAELIQTYAPTEAVFEQIFLDKNPGTALKLGQARGAAIAVAAVHALSIHEYTARQVKKAIVGYGAADKQQMQHMVKFLLKLETTPPVDAADALGAALCHAYMRQGLQRLGDAALKMRYQRLR